MKRQKFTRYQSLMAEAKQVLHDEFADAGKKTEADAARREKIRRAFRNMNVAEGIVAELVEKKTKA